MDALSVDANDRIGRPQSIGVQGRPNRKEGGLLVRQLREKDLKKTTLRLALRKFAEGDELCVDVASPFAFGTLSPSLDAARQEASV